MSDEKQSGGFQAGEVERSEDTFHNRRRTSTFWNRRNIGKLKLALENNRQ